MTSAVAIPIRFGSTRFGLIKNGTLSTDLRPYTQPTGSMAWQYGQTILLAPAEASVEAEEYGYMPNAIIGGGSMNLYGKPLNGYIFCDTHGYRWLITLDFGSPDFSTNSIAINYTTRRFGLFGYGVAFDSTTRSMSLGDIGMGGFAIERVINGGTYSATFEYSGDEMVHLVSTNSDGSKAVLALVVQSLTTFRIGKVLRELGLDNYPLGYLQIAATSAELAGTQPSLSLSVLRTLQQTVGTQTCIETYTAPIDWTTEIQCSRYIEYVDPNILSSSGGTKDVIAALFFDNNDQLVEMKVGNSYAATTTVNAPDISDDVITQTSTYENTITTFVSCSGRIVQSTIVHSQAVTASGVCEGTPTEFNQYYSKSESWVYSADDGTTLTYSADSNAVWDEYYILETADFASGCFMLDSIDTMIPQDILYSQEYFSASGVDGGSLIPFMRRYSYNVIGLELLRLSPSPDYDLSFLHYDNALSPAAKILSTAFPAWTADDLEAKYGSYNPRTHAAIACQTVPVCYV